MFTCSQATRTGWSPEERLGVGGFVLIRERLGVGGFVLRRERLGVGGFVLRRERLGVGGFVLRREIMRRLRVEKMLSVFALKHHLKWRSP